MSPPATLTSYYTKASTDADNAVTSLQATVSQANDALAAAQTALGKVTASLAADQAANVALRISLSQAALPSDATHLVAQLQQNLIQTRIDQAAVGTATDEFGAATRAQQAALTGLVAAQQAQQQAAAALAASQANDAAVASWTALVNAAPVTDAFAAVNDPSAAAVLNQADSALETIVGPGMLLLFRQRRDDFLASGTALDAAVTAAASAQQALQQANEPLTAAVTQAQAAYAADVQELQDLATRAASDIGSALALLTSAANVGSLSPDEQQPITAAAAAALAQVPAEQAVFTANAQLRTDQASLDAIALDAWRSNPDFDPANDPTTAAARQAIQDDETALATASGTLASGQLDIDNWQVLIPEAVMQLVVGVVQAETTLASYQAKSVSALLADLATRESAYAGALDALLTYQRSTALIADQLASRQGEVAPAAQVAAARENAAIRGAL
jgi:trimeric autotransporter adhesin